MQTNENTELDMDKNSIDASIKKIKEALDGLIETHDFNIPYLVKYEPYNKHQYNKVLRLYKIENQEYKKNLEKYCEYLGWYGVENSINIDKYKKYKNRLRFLTKKWISNFGTLEELNYSQEYKAIKNKLDSIYQQINNYNQNKQNILENIKRFKHRIKRTKQKIGRLENIKID